jgi:predicted kinase
LKNTLSLPNRADKKRTHETADLVLIRGLPGSGKSTIARTLGLVGYQHFEADMFFEVDGKYQYDASRIREAHDWCKRSTKEALSKNMKVVVSNTFTRQQELAPYLEMSDKIQIVEAQGNWKNRHDVPEQVIRNMAARWEQIEPSIKISDQSIH